MVEKIFDKISSTHELNQIAANLKRLNQTDKLMKLAKDNKVSEWNVKEFLSGKRYFLTDGGDTRNSYSTARSKLLEEMFLLKDPMYGDVIGNYLLQNCEGEVLSGQILQKHKTLQRCLEYVMEQVFQMIKEEDKKNSKGVGIAVDQEQVYGWVRAYYGEDDKEKWEKDAEEAETKFQKRNEVLKKAETKRTAKKGKAAGKTKVKEEPSKDKRDNKDNKSSSDGQISLFDSMNMAEG